MIEYDSSGGYEIFFNPEKMKKDKIKIPSEEEIEKRKQILIERYCDKYAPTVLQEAADFKHNKDKDRVGDLQFLVNSLLNMKEQQVVYYGNAAMCYEMDYRNEQKKVVELFDEAVRQKKRAIEAEKRIDQQEEEIKSLIFIKKNEKKIRSSTSNRRR